MAKEVAFPLSILFNRSFKEGKFAESWKYSNVIPLPKKEIILIHPIVEHFHSYMYVD